MIRCIVAICFAIVFCHCGQTQSNAPSSKDKAVGGPCDGCDMMYEGMPAPEKISNTVSIAGENEPGERMTLQGMMYRKDGKTPAANVILYLYHTDAKGLYSRTDTQTDGLRHGHLRGWVKTDAQGRFTIHSIRPAAYPGRTIPEHIHILVKEPGLTRYWIDEVWFADDTIITPKMKAAAEKRGGDLLIPLVKNAQGQWEGRLVITAGLHVPGYQTP
jgi:protocatechuate 3,4-dioxygenase beta subunit